MRLLRGRVQENPAAVPAAAGPGDGGAGLLQPGQHLHPAAAVREGHRLPPQAPAHRPGAHGPVRAHRRAGAIRPLYRSCRRQMQI